MIIYNIESHKLLNLQTRLCSHWQNDVPTIQKIPVEG